MRGSGESDEGNVKIAAELNMITSAYSASAPGYTYVYDGYYTVTASATDWDTAETTCISLGGYLATITSSNQNAALLSAFSTKVAGSAVWIGYKRVSSGGAFAWADGSTSTYTNWVSGEPNNQNGCEICTQLFISTGQWNDYACATNACGSSVASFQGICKRALPPSCITWMVGAQGASCDSACATLGISCDSICQSKPNTVVEANAALMSAGGFQAVGKSTCSAWSDDGNGVNGAFDPGYYPPNGACYYASGTASTCGASSGAQYRLCACTTPTASPTSPSSVPSVQPSTRPSVQPSTRPSTIPTVKPSTTPSVRPSTPSLSPTAKEKGKGKDKGGKGVKAKAPEQTEKGKGKDKKVLDPYFSRRPQATMAPKAVIIRHTRPPKMSKSPSPKKTKSSIPNEPSDQPSVNHSNEPTAQFNVNYSSEPSDQPSATPSDEPTDEHSRAPSIEPSYGKRVFPSQ